MTGPIHLETYNHRLSEIRVDSNLIGPAYKAATLSAMVEVHPKPAQDDRLAIRYALLDNAGEVIKEETAPYGEKLDWKLKDEVEAWWPVNYGKQPLYHLETTLLDKVSL